MIVNFNQGGYAHHIHNLFTDKLWYDGDFTAAFCAGCPDCWGDDCPAGLDGLDVLCQRRGLADAVESIIAEAGRAIACELDNYGCIDAAEAGGF
ncbi:MAG: hypothetical protein IJU98_07590 [Synergistaceae bacterium]|nr:hypothetical protein [Synergistaceae bacterium]